jgi:hypothetical protein
MYEFKKHVFTSSGHLHSDSEQFIYNWMLEDDLGLDLRKSEGSQTDERKSGQTWQSRWIKVQQGRHRQKGIVMQTKVVMWIHANQGHCYANQVVMWTQAN